MKINLSRVALAALSGAVFSNVTLISHAQDTSTNKPERPRVVIPRVAQIPVVDGILAPGEWDKAAGVSGFVAPHGHFRGRVAPYQSRIYVTHDGAKVYLGVYVELAPGSKPSMKYRRRDEPVYMDTHQLEFWLTPPAQGQVVAYQFIGNAYGAIYDNRQIPALGNTVAGWNGDYEFKNHYETGKYWSAEIAVPFASFTKTPVTPDQLWGALIGVAWPQRAWPYTFGWYKNIDSHAQWSFSNDLRAARLEDLSPLFDNRLGATITVVNGEQAGAFKVRAQVGDKVAEQTVTVGAEASTRVVLDGGELPPFDKSEDSRPLRLEVIAPDGAVLLRGEWPYAPVAPEKRVQKAHEAKPWGLSTRVLFAPEAMGLKAWADLLDYPRRDQLKSVRFRVRPVGGTQDILAHEITDFSYDSAQTYLWLPKESPVGAYEVQTEFLAQGGELLDAKTDAFARKDEKSEFAWWKNTIGTQMKVAPPFTPIVSKGNTLSVWGRDYHFDGAFPTQIVSLGREMLAAPVQLMAVVNGQAQAAKIVRPFTPIKNDAARAEWSGQYEVAGVVFDVQGALEFDGAVFYDVKARPGPGSRVERIYLSIPVKPENATYFHSTSGGWSPGFGVIDAQAKPGRVWSSDVLGGFVPYVGVSDDERGLQWFADNEHDWLLGDKVPTASIERSANAVEVQVNIARKAGVISQPFGAQFGLIATPVKPMPSQWRTTVLDSSAHYGSKINFFYGPGHGGAPIDLHDTATLAKVLGVDTEGKNPDTVLSNLPKGATSIDLARMREVLKDKTGDALKVVNWKPGDVRNHYFMNASMYFEGNRSAAFRTFFPGDWQLDPPSGWFHLTTTPSYRDFYAFYFDIWLKHWKVPGMYFDEVYLGPDNNLFNGNGKLMPDGTVRPTVALMQQRAFLQRIWQTFHDNGQQPFIWVHSSNYMAPYSISVADIAMFGEDRKATPNQDYFDTVPAALMRSFGRSQKFGLIPVWMDMEGRGSSGNLAPTSRDNWGWCWMHDAIPEYHTSNVPRPLWGLRTAWGIGNDGVRFLPYWNNGGAVTSADPNVLVSAWTQPNGKVLLQVLNLNHEAVTAKIDLAPQKLGLRPGFKIYDLESQPNWAQAKTQLEQYWEQKRQNPAVASAEINKLLNDEARYNSHDANTLKTLGTGPSFSVALPAREWGLYVVE